jgi:hypothetical protein
MDEFIETLKEKVITCIAEYPIEDQVYIMAELIEKLTEASGLIWLASLEAEEE